MRQALKTCLRPRIFVDCKNLQGKQSLKVFPGNAYPSNIFCKKISFQTNITVPFYSGIKFSAHLEYWAKAWEGGCSSIIPFLLQF